VLAVVEIPLVSKLATSAAAQAVMLQMHSRSRAHLGQVLAITLAEDVMRNPEIAKSHCPIPSQEAGAAGTGTLWPVG
jgi:hypothetical protein